MNKEKLKIVIDCLKTSNYVMEKQIALQQRTIELLGEFITEPEQLDKDSHLLGGVPKDDKVEPETIKPEDMKAGEWYVLKSWYNWMFKFRKISKEQIYTFKHICLDDKDCNSNGGNMTRLNRIKSLRKATQQEILKYFPNEFEVDTHGGNDAGHIASLTNPQLK